MRPTSSLRLPWTICRSSSVSLPHCSWTLPVNCFQLPSMRSQFIPSPPWFFRRPVPAASDRINGLGMRSFRTVAVLQQSFCHNLPMASGGLKERPAKFNATGGGPATNSLRQDDSCSFLPDERPPSFFFFRNLEPLGSVAQG